MTTAPRDGLSGAVAAPEEVPPPVIGVPPLEHRENLYFALRAIVVLNLICLVLVSLSRTQIDYRSFYAAGRIELTSPASTYDAAAQIREQHRLFPEQDGWTAFFHPPIELLLFAPLARLPYRASLVSWTAISASFLLLSIQLLSRLFNLKWQHVAVLAGALFPACFVFYEAQDSFLLLYALVAGLYLLQRDRDGLAGIVLSAALFKPQIPLVIAAALLLQGRRRFFGAFVASSSAIGVASAAYLGKARLMQIRSLLRIAEPLDEAWRMPCIRGAVSLLHISRLIAVIVSVALLIVFAIRWYRAPRHLVNVYCSAIMVGALVGYHLHAYDLCVLLIPAAYFLVTGASRIQWVAFFLIGASPVFLLLATNHATALLAIPLLVLAIVQSWAVPRPAAG